MNTEQWNALYPVGTPVFAYPGFRPEDASDARRLVTRTRTAAQLSPSGDPVVWVEGEGSYICLTHVDPVSESVWRAAKEAEETAAAVAAQAALPVPVGDQPLDDQRLAEIGGVRDALRRSTKLIAAPAAAAIDELLAEVQRLRAERHSTNEALSDTAKALREMRDRLAEYERPADAYPPALPWARLMDDEDLAEFLAEMEHAIATPGATPTEALAAAETACGTWRLIAEAQHAHNTAPGPDASQNSPAPKEA